MWLVSSPIGEDPDLIEMNRLGRRRIELAMPNASAGRHALKLARPQHRAVAEAVLMPKFALEHIGDDLHILMAMHAEALARRDAVLVHHP